MKTLKDLECTVPCLDKIWGPQQKFALITMLQESVKEWIKEIEDITNNYVENGGDLSDDGVIAIIKEKHPEWIAFMGDWSDDNLSRLYFLCDWAKYFFNLGEK